MAGDVSGPADRSDSVISGPGGFAGYDVFLSHNTSDREIVAIVGAGLHARGLRPWLDQWEIVAGDRFQQHLADALDDCAACAVFVGARDVGTWQREEVEVALNRAARDRSFRVFLVLLPGVPEPFEPSRVSPFLSTRSWIDLRSGVSDHAIGGLAQAIVGESAGLPMGSSASTEDSPYLGLRAFEEDDADRYFGRDADIQRVAEKLKAHALLSVLGPSGSGKSSLVRAGVIPAIRRGGVVAGSADWGVHVLTPGPHPLDSLAATTSKILGGRSPVAIREDLMRTETSLRTLLTGAPPMLLVVDQFEECFALCDDEAERRMFVGNLLHTASLDADRRVIVAMRADFYANCAAYPDLAEAISDSQFLVGRLSDAQLRQVIEMPALRLGVRFEGGLVDSIIDDVRGSAGALPLLGHALLELWEAKQGSTLTHASYQQLGGVDAALTNRAELVWNEFTHDQQRVAKAVLLRLVQPGQGVEDTRRPAAIDELSSAAFADLDLGAVLEDLTQARLLTADRVGDVELVEVTHEALIRGWPRLRGWLDEGREDLHMLRRIATASTDWANAARDDDFLYRGTSLLVVEEWAAEHGERLNQHEVQFIEAGLALREAQAEAAIAARARARQQRRRVLVSLSLLASLLLVASIVAAVAWVDARSQTRRAQEEARVANSARLALVSSDLLANAPDLAGLLAIAAHDLNPSPLTEGALFDFTFGAGGKLIARGATFGELAFAFDGRLLVAEEAGISIWDAETRELIGNLGDTADQSLLGSVGVIEVNPDGRLAATLAFTAEGDELSVWDVQARAEVQRFGVPERGGPGHFSSTMLAWSHDSSALALSSDSPDEQTLVFDVATEQVAATLDAAGSAVFTADGDQLIVQGLERVGVWDVATGQMVSELDTTNVALEVGFASASESGVTIDTFSSGVFRLADGSILLWGIDGVERWEANGSTFTRREDTRLAGEFGLVSRVLVEPGGRFGLVGNVIYDLVDEIPLASIPGGRLDSEIGTFGTLSLDGEFLVLEQDDLSLEVLSTGELSSESIVGLEGWIAGASERDGDLVLATESFEAPVEPLPGVDIGATEQNPDPPEAGGDDVEDPSDEEAPEGPFDEGFDAGPLFFPSVFFVFSGRLDALSDFDREVIDEELFAVLGLGANGRWLLAEALGGGIVAVDTTGALPSRVVVGTTGELGHNVEISPTDPVVLRVQGQTLTLVHLEAGAEDTELGRFPDNWFGGFSPTGNLLLAWPIDEDGAEADPTSAPADRRFDTELRSPDGEILRESTVELDRSLMDIDQIWEAHALSDELLLLQGVTGIAVLNLEADTASVLDVDRLRFHNPAVLVADRILLHTGNFARWYSLDGERIGSPFAAGDFGGAMFKVDSDAVVLIDEQGFVTRVDVSPESWRRDACDRVGRNMTSEEWARFFPSESYRPICEQWPGLGE